MFPDYPTWSGGRRWEYKPCVVPVEILSRLLLSLVHFVIASTAALLTALTCAAVGIVISSER